MLPAEYGPTPGQHRYEQALRNGKKAPGRLSHRGLAA
jgi:hypothetical protein